MGVFWPYGPIFDPKNRAIIFFCLPQQVRTIAFSSIPIASSGPKSCLSSQNKLGAPDGHTLRPGLFPRMKTSKGLFNPRPVSPSQSLHTA
jgi:hypothetical protein